MERISLDDAAFFVDLVNSPNWLRFIGDRNVSNLDEAQTYLRNGLIKSYADHGFGYYIVRLKSSRQPIGIGGFLKKPYLENPDFGFALLPEYYQQGFAYEYSQAILSYGVQEYKFQVLDAVTTADNVRSMQLLRKLDFEHAGTIQGDDGKSLNLFRWRKQNLVAM
ncbi:MAG: GNAT family N-acetyltransferase [Pirellulales bacterium]